MSKIEVNTVAPQCGTTLTLGESGDTVTLGAGASQSGFGRTGTVDWQTAIKTADFTAANGEGYFVIHRFRSFYSNTYQQEVLVILLLLKIMQIHLIQILTIGRNGSKK